MANKAGGLLTLATVLLGMAALIMACQGQEAAPTASPAPTPDIQATVEAAVQAALPTASPTPMLNIEATVQAKVQAILTAAPAAAPTATPIPAATSLPTAMPMPAPTMVPTATPNPTPIPTNTPRPTPTPYLSAPIYGPVGDTIVHEPDDRFLEQFRGPEISGDVMVEATFHNPYPTSEGSWNYGFLLGKDRRSFYQWVRIQSDGTWAYSYRLGVNEPTENMVDLERERTSSIDTTSQGKNQLRLIIIGDEGWLYINGKFQGKLDLSALTGVPLIALVIDDDRVGATPFEDFAIWKWDSSLVKLPAVTPTPIPGPTPHPSTPIYGPVSGDVVHNIQKPQNYFELFRGPRIAGDVMVQATFHNPYSTKDGSWNYGFLLRNDDAGFYHWIYVESRQQWFHSRRRGERHFTLALRKEKTFDIDTTPGGRNQLRLVIVGDSVWFYINGRFQGNASLRTMTDLDQISLVINDEREGVTRFEDFTVWKWYPPLQELPKPEDD